MAAKTWRLVVTELGGSSTLHEVTVEAANWMKALQLGRGDIGEDGVVPTGASCAVAPDGKVTIHDPVARRTYLLTPDVAKSFKRQAPHGPRIPGDETAAPKKKVSKQTIAYAPAVPGDPTAPPAAAPAAPQAAAPAPAPTPAPTPAAPAPQAAPQPAPTPAAPPPAAPQPAPAAAKPTPAAAAAGPAQAAGEWQLLSERSEAPTAESPLHYRERTFVVAEGTAKQVAERILRERFEDARRELEDEPPGKFFNLAIFDHAWEGRPKRPPVVTLQWKDWRGEPELAYPLEARQKARAAKQASAPPSAPPPAAASRAEPASVVVSPELRPQSPPATTAQPAAQAPQSAAPAPQPAPQAPQPAAPAPQPAPQAPQKAPQAAPPNAHRGTTITDEHDARLAQAFEASQDLFFLSTPAEGLDFVVQLLADLIPSEASTACLYDINTDEFRFVVLTGPGGDERKGEAIPAQTGLMGAAAERVGAAYIVPNVAKDDRFDPGVDGRVGLEPKNAMYMPLHHQGRLLGILQLINRQGPRSVFDDADAEVISYVGRQIAQFLYQARIAPDQGARL